MVAWLLPMDVGHKHT